MTKVGTALLFVGAALVQGNALANASGSVVWGDVVREGGEVKLMNFYDADRYCISQGGGTRLPTIRELAELVTYAGAGMQDPAFPSDGGGTNPGFNEEFKRMMAAAFGPVYRYTSPKTRPVLVDFYYSYRGYHEPAWVPRDVHGWDDAGKVIFQSSSDYPGNSDEKYVLRADWGGVTDLSMGQTIAVRCVR